MFVFYGWVSQKEDGRVGFTAMVGVDTDNEDDALIAGSAHLRVLTRMEVETLGVRPADKEEEENFRDVGNYVTPLA
jgi:hypothetical protein